jgi:hypothetical protein
MRRVGPLLTLVVLIPFVLSPVPAAAQATTDAGAARPVNADLSVPESPAFAILGLTPQTVVRPSNTQELAASLLSGVDRHGNFQSGLALDFAPYPLLYGDAVTLGQYQRNPDGFNPTRFLWRLQTSAATAKGASTEDKSIRLSLGVRLTPWDLGDPRLDSSTINPARRGVIDCYKDVAKAVTGVPIDPGDPTAIAEADKRLKAGSQTCREEAAKYLWNNSSFSFGAAPTWISTDGTADNLESNGGGVWASVGYGFENIPGLENTAHFILHAKYHADERVPDTKARGQFLKQDTTTLGARLRLLMTDRFNLSAEGSWIHEDRARRSTSESARIAVSAEYRLASGVWIEFSVGGEGGRRDGNNQAFALGTVKWGTSNEPSIK